MWATSNLPNVTRMFRNEILVKLISSARTMGSTLQTCPYAKARKDGDTVDNTRDQSTQQYVVAEVMISSTVPASSLHQPELPDRQC